MKKSYYVIFVVTFLAIIFTIPAVQTVYEYRKNSGHRIQMLDLPYDIFVSPLHKAKNDKTVIDSLTNCATKLYNNLQQQSSDTLNTTGNTDVPNYLDEAQVRMTMLKQSVKDYNRHLSGDKNRFFKEDSLKPYYQKLLKIQSMIDSTLEYYNQNQIQRVLALSKELADETANLGSYAVRHQGIRDYLSLTITALKRTMVGADYLRPYEKEMEKSSVFSNTVRPKMLLAYYKLFHDPGDKAIRGLHSWLYYRPDVEYLTRYSVLDKHSVVVDPNDVPIRDAIIDSIVAFKDHLASRNIELLLVIMPTKASIYPDMATRRMTKEQSGTFSHSLNMMKRLDKAGVTCVDLFSAFAKERNNDVSSGDSLYLSTDTHFKTRGVLATARTVAQRVRQFPWYTAGQTEYSTDTITVDRNGDIAEMTTIPAMKIPSLKNDFLPEATRCEQVFSCTRDESGAIVEQTLYKDDYQRSSILVLGDSFSRIYQTDEPRSAGWIAHLAKELSQPVASIVNDGGASTLVRQTLARKPQLLKNKKLVIWEIVERDFRFGAEGWKNIKL